MKIDCTKIKLLMGEQEISHSILAERCGISRQNISAMLARGTASAAKIVKLAKILGVDAEEIIKED